MMTDKTSSNNLDAPKPEKKVPPLRKGALVKVNRKAYQLGIESKASDPTPPQYIFEGPGEVLSIKEEYAQIRWRRPVPDVWLRINQLEAFQ